MSDLSDDLRKAAANEASIFPAWVRKELGQEADRMDEADQRWARLAETDGPTRFTYDTKESTK